MSPAALLRHLHAELEAYASANGGELSVAGDAFHVLELLQGGPGRWRLILQWAGDRPLDERGRDGLVRNQLKLIVGVPTGMRKDPGAALVFERYNEEPILDRWHDLRALILGRQWPLNGTQQEVMLQYGGSKPLIAPNGVPMAAYEGTFTLVTQLTADTA
jgi:hypothetical protein